MFDEYHDHLCVRGLSPVSITGAGTSSSQAVDRLGAGGPYQALTFYLTLGALNSITATVVLQESDSGAFGGEENAVADADLLGLEADLAFTEADANKVGQIGYSGNKRFVRMQIVASAAAGANLVGITAILGRGGRLLKATEIPKTT